MIREFKEQDLEKVANIWLISNIDAHFFIPKDYWKGHFDEVKEMFLQAEIYVYEKDCEVQGFISLNKEYIEGIFVSKEVQSKGIGKDLLNFVKERNEFLYLSVYQRNERAIHFYQREGFQIKCANIDEQTGEKEYEMIWYKNKGNKNNEMVRKDHYEYDRMWCRTAR